MTDHQTSSDQAVRVAALYRFAPVANPEAVRMTLQAVCDDGQVRGTLLVAPEGLNGTIAGSEAAVAAVLSRIHAMPGFETLELKYAWTDALPFHRMKVRVKREIVTMGQPDLDPPNQAGVYVTPTDWNALIADPETLVIDTRNDYEGEIGAFERAVQPNTRSFRDFPDWFRSEGRALLSVRHGDKERVVNLAAKLLELGYDLDATHGTAVTLGEASINPRLVNKVHEGRPHILDRIKNGEYTYIVNTAEGRQAIEDSKQLRRGALQHKVAYTTTLHAAFATCMAISVDATANVNSVQELHQKVKNR